MDEPSQEACFSFVPSFEYEKESQDYIYEGDPLFIVSTMEWSSKIEEYSYLHSSKTIEREKEEKLKEINISTRSKTMWKFINSLIFFLIFF